MTFIQLFKCPFCPNRDNKEWKSLLLHFDQRFYIVKVLLEPTVLVRNSWHQSCKMASKPARKPPRWKQSAASTVNMKWLIFALHTHSVFEATCKWTSCWRGQKSYSRFNKCRTERIMENNLDFNVFGKKTPSSLFIFTRHAHNNEDFDCFIQLRGRIYIY